MNSVSKWLVGVALVLVPAWSPAVEIAAIPAELAQKLAQGLLPQAEKIDQPQIKLVAAVDQTNGYHVPRMLGAMVVPQKDLKETEELAAKFKEEPGASRAYLFTYQLIPVVDGQRLATDSLRTVEIQDGEGNTRTLHVWLLAVRQTSDSDYRLHVYGKAPKPLVDVAFAQASGPNTQPVMVELKDADESTREGKVVLTVFGKYQATFTAAYTGE